MGSAGAARRESGANSCWCSSWWGRCQACWSRRPVAATMTVANLLMPVAGLIKARYRGAKADIDSPFFKLHYRTTATLFFICCLLVTANDLIGSTISCFGPEGVPGGLLNTYCWIMSTFSVPGSGGAHPGLGPETGEETVHAYYQWVPFVLFLQGVMFYIPHYLWKTFEHKKIDKITSGVRGKTLPINTDKRRDSLEDQINFINFFLGGVFMTYGTEVIDFMNMDDANRTDPMMKVFPRVTKCTFHHYGPSGTVNKKDALCILGPNIINEKIYVTLWFWLVILACMTAVYLIYVVAIIAVPGLRRGMVTRKARADHVDQAYHLVTNASTGDWFMIFLVSRNMDSTMYNIFIEEITEKFKTKA